MNARSDTELVQRAREGDAGAFETLYARYHARVYRLLYGMLGNRDDAVDLTQEVFIRAWIELPRLQIEKTLYGWLRRTAINLGIDYLRRRRLVQFQSLDVSPDEEESEPFEWQIPDETQDVEAAVMQSELQECLQQALQRLSTIHRVVVVLHYIEEVPVEEIAQQLSIPVGTVKSRLARAREALRRQLEPLLNKGNEHGMH
ncbi:MAG: sigma-70 family RNA polymerase sigma factor [Fimbriimonadales bacterium]|nr:sigma-70 family RNA polymerase sigma factor [Fimbriimonadales bacterium]